MGKEIDLKLETVEVKGGKPIKMTVRNMFYKGFWGKLRTRINWFIKGELTFQEYLDSPVTYERVLPEDIEAFHGLDVEAELTKILIEELNKTPFLEIDCPSCGKEVKTLKRYPNAICNGCCNEITDEDGSKITFFNTHILGTGLGGAYEDGTEYNNPIGYKERCWVNGIECVAEEAKFGGIVIQKQI